MRMAGFSSCVSDNAVSAIEVTCFLALVGDSFDELNVSLAFVQHGIA